MGICVLRLPRRAPQNSGCALNNAAPHQIALPARRLTRRHGASTSMDIIIAFALPHASVRARHDGWTNINRKTRIA